jgi:hypothetical protein
MSFIKRDELIAALEARAQQIKGNLAHGEYAIAAIDDVETPAHVREMLRLMSARAGAEIAWSAAFVERLRKGEYRTAGDPLWSPVGARAEAKPTRARSKRTAKRAPRKAKSRRP